MKRDILQEIYDGSISSEQAEKAYDAAMDADVTHAADELGLSDIEFASYGKVGFEELARWRYEGWPDICPTCGRKIENIEKGGWVVKRINGAPRLVHIACLPGPTEEEKQVRSEFQEHAVPDFYNYFGREVALSFVRRATQLNLAVVEVWGMTIRDAKVQEAPKDLMWGCWDEVRGETWEEFRDQCAACAERFLRTVSPREGLAFDLELESEEKWPKLKALLEEIKRERKERSDQR